MHPALPIVANDRTRPYWELFATTKRLHLLRCRSCRRYVHYPRGRCPRCWSDDLGWEPVDGTGQLVTWTIARRPTAPELVDLVPFTIGLVALDVQPTVHVVAALTDVDETALAVGLPVTVVPLETTAGVLPAFAPRPPT